MAVPSKQKRDDKGLVRLMQLVIREPVRLVEDDADSVCLIGRNRQVRFARALLELALSRGLISRKGANLEATAEAAPWLKRLLADVDRGFTAQHGPLKTEGRLVDGARAEVTVNTAHSTLSLLSRMKEKDGTDWFPEPAISAGERLAADFHYAGLQPKVTAHYGPRIVSSTRGDRGRKAEMSDSQVDARSRFSRAATALGPELAGVAIDVCCFSKGLEQVEKERQWPARSAKLMLRTALLSLSRHYRDGRSTPPASRSRP